MSIRLIEPKLLKGKEHAIATTLPWAGFGDAPPKTAASNKKGKLPDAFVQIVDQKALEARLKQETREREGLVKSLKTLGDPKELVLATSAHFDELRQLEQTLPHHAALFVPLRNRVKIQAATHQPLQLGRMLLGGEPGIGKSYAVHAIAEALKLPLLEIQLAGNSDILLFTGTAKQWGNSAPGVLTRFMSTCPVANPLVVLEEVDKTGANSHGSVQDVLLMLLEPENSKNFDDRFLNLPIDLSNLSYLATANDLDALTLPLLSRLAIVELEAPGREHLVQLVQRLYDLLTEGLGLSALFEKQLPADLVSELIFDKPGLRLIRQRLESGIAAAVEAYETPETLASASKLLPVIRTVPIKSARSPMRFV